MMDVLGVAILLGLGLSFAWPLLPNPKRERRNLKGVKLTRNEWALLGDIAALKQLSQSAMASAILKQYLHDRISDKHLPAGKHSR